METHMKKCRAKIDCDKEATEPFQVNLDDTVFMCKEHYKEIIDLLDDFYKKLEGKE